MSKLSFRARALDASKPMPIYLAEELPDLPDYSAINRAVPQMPSGMEKEEESEHHLQRAISGTGLIIPTPEVCEVNDLQSYERCYPPDYKMPKQHIHMQPFARDCVQKPAHQVTQYQYKLSYTTTQYPYKALWEEQEAPEYDMDSEDERWLRQQRHPDLTELLFEQMMDRLEKSSGQTVVTLSEAKLLLERADDLVIAVYDYWLNKRLTTQHPLILSVKTESRPGQSGNNPYLAFRRRTEKMQTRKNRKNDESSYEKMLKLRRELARALALLQLVARREAAKRELLALTAALADSRYRARDYNEPPPPPQRHQPHHNDAQQHHRSAVVAASFRREPFALQQFAPPLDARQREKRPYKRRKHRHHTIGAAVSTREAGVSSSSEESLGREAGGSSPDPGPFAFRRKPGCYYQLPTTTLCGDPAPGTAGDLFEHELDPRHRYTLVSVSDRCVGFARRRIGRGGRVLLDRYKTVLDDLWPNLPLATTPQEESPDKWHRYPKETWRDYLEGDNRWRRAFRKHVSRNTTLWIASPPHTLQDDVKMELEDPKPEPDLDKTELPLEAPSWGGKAHAWDCSARAALRKRSYSSSDDSIQDSEPLAPVEQEFKAFINEVDSEWLHFRPRTPPPSPPLTAPPALAGDEPFAVELFPDLNNCFTSNPLTLDQLHPPHTTELPTPLPLEDTTRLNVREVTPPPIPRPRAPTPPVTPTLTPTVATTSATIITTKVTVTQASPVRPSPPKKAATVEHERERAREREREREKERERERERADRTIVASNVTIEDTPQQVKVEKKKNSETIEEVVLAHGVQLKTVQTKHSPLKKHIITSRPTDGATPAAPQILTVAVSDSLKVRLQNHLVSSGQATVSASSSNGPFTPSVALLHPATHTAVGSVSSGSAHAGVVTGVSAGVGRRAPLVSVSRPPPTTPVVLAPSHTIHHVAPNKLKVLHAHPLHPLTHTQRNQLLGARGSLAQLPAVVSLGGLNVGGQALIKGTPALTQFIEIKGAPLGKGPHLVNVVRGAGVAGVAGVASAGGAAGAAVGAGGAAHAHKPRAPPDHDATKRHLLFDAAHLKGNIQAVSRPHRVSVSVEGRAAAAVRAPHVRHQIQLKGRALVGGVSTGLGPPAAATAHLSQHVVANLLHKNVHLPKGGQKISIGNACVTSGVGAAGGVGGAGVTALTLAGGLKARAPRLHAPATHNAIPQRAENVGVGVGVGVSGGGAGPSGAGSGDARRRNADTLPMEVT